MIKDVYRFLFSFAEGSTLITHALALRSKMATCLCALLLATSGADLQALETAQEYEIKAVYIAKLTNFITWPDTVFSHEDSPLTLCVLGDNPFSNNLENVAAKSRSNGRVLEVQYSEVLEDTQTCHILYISPSEHRRVTNIIENLEKRPLLTISDNHTFVQLGGMIELYRNKQRQIRLAVDLESIQETGLKVSAKLLRIAKVVRGDHQEVE